MLYIKLFSKDEKDERSVKAVRDRITGIISSKMLPKSKVEVSTPDRNYPEMLQCIIKYWQTPYPGMPSDWRSEGGRYDVETFDLGATLARSLIGYNGIETARVSENGFVSGLDGLLDDLQANYSEGYDYLVKGFNIQLDGTQVSFPEGVEGSLPEEKVRAALDQTQQIKRGIGVFVASLAGLDFTSVRVASGMESAYKYAHPKNGRYLSVIHSPAVDSLTVSSDRPIGEADALILARLRDAVNYPAYSIEATFTKKV